LKTKPGKPGKTSPKAEEMKEEEKGLDKTFTSNVQSHATISEIHIDPEVLLKQ
jgi:hypothetical protein